MEYTCVTCGAPAEVVDAKVIKHCDCPSGVAAHLEATATGEGTMA